MRRNPKVVQLQLRSQCWARVVRCPPRAQPRVPIESWHMWGHQAAVSIAVSLIPDQEWARTGESRADPYAGGGGHELSSWAWAQGLGARHGLMVAWQKLQAGSGGLTVGTEADMGRLGQDGQRLQVMAHSGVRLEV